jgi:membrane fusion protein (multidrug efflux system)
VQAQANLVRAKQDAARYGQLYNTTMKAVSKAEVDAATAARASATADVTARQDNVTAAKAQITAAASARDVLKAQVKVLQAQLKDASSSSATTRSWRRCRAASASAASKSARASSRASSWPPSCRTTSG